MHHYIVTSSLVWADGRMAGESEVFKTMNAARRRMASLANQFSSQQFIRQEATFSHLKMQQYSKGVVTATLDIDLKVRS